MSDMSHFFRSAGGIEMVPEVCLKVVEAAIDCDPQAARSLMLVSKLFYLLLKNYEKSITKSISTNDKSISHVNINQHRVLSSWMPPAELTVESLSYSWFSEMRCRSTAVEYLISHELTEMLDHDSSWPTLDIPEPEFLKRLEQFKRNSFLLLFQLADCAAGIMDDKGIRIRQSEFLKCLTARELACIGCMVEVIGQGFFTLTKNAVMASELGSSLTSRTTPTTTPAAPTVNFYTPSHVPVDDLMNENWIRESMCVFEDRVQRYGPYFAWAYLAGSQEKIRRPDLWARVELQKGLSNMDQFELGYTMSFASLQSVVWSVFCRKVNCSIVGSWSVAKELVEMEMESYTIIF